MLRHRMCLSSNIVGKTLVLCAISACTANSPELPVSLEEPASVENGTFTVVGTAPQASRSSPSVVILQPHSQVASMVPEEALLLDQLGRTFIPSLIVIRVGQPLFIRNSENDLHNVRIIEGATGEVILNIGMLMGSTYLHTFDRPGTYTIQCDIHTSMFADVVATTAPHSTMTDREGNFTLSEVPAGDYTVTVLFGGSTIERTVQITDAVTPLILRETEP